VTTTASEVSTSAGADDALVAVDVTVTFSGVKALDGVTFLCKPGEIVGLIGPNGSGKTTLLNTLSGFLEPASGIVRFRGEETRRWSPEQHARRGLARTFQGVRPFAQLTVRENIEVGAIGVGASRREARERASELLEELGLTELAATWAGILPAGSQRRLGIARALAAEPSFLLLDEPAAGLHEAETDAVIDFIGRIRETRRAGVTLVEHDMRVVMRLCERVQVLDNGITLAEGSPNEIRSNERVLEAYLGTGSVGSARGS
jgi:ABC-type branched-subunit amino acid transport system ATPase component